MLSLEHITIIGLGSIGGFLAKCLTSINTVKKMTFIDHDIVEEKNLCRSIYRKTDIGKQKVIAAKEIIENSTDICVNAMSEKYNNQISTNNLIIDCRDTTDKHENIPCKLSVSGRSLILDCSIKKNNVAMNGYYREKINKSDLQNGLSDVTSIMTTSFFPQLIKNKLTYIVNLNKSSQKVFDVIKNNNLCLENPIISSKINGLQFISDNIIEINKHYDITIYRIDNPSMKIKLKKGEIIDIMMLCKKIESITFMNDYNFFANFIDKNCIELIPEIGAA